MGNPAGTVAQQGHSGPARRAVSAALWPGLVLLVLFLTQVGSVAQEVIDWDETTFLLMGQEILDGHLPYVRIFDVKPPGIFLFLAAVTGLFGKSIVAVRLAGDLLLAAGFLAAHAIALRRTGPVAAGLGTLMAVAALAGPFGGPELRPLPASALPFGLHTGTETLVIAFFMPAFWLLLRWPGSLRAAALCGLLMSLATLTRPNFAFPVILFGLVWLWRGLRPGREGGRRSLGLPLAYAAAGLVPLALLVGTYARAGELGILRLAVIDVSLAYAADQLTMAAAAYRHARQYFHLCLAYPQVYGLFALMLGAGLALALGGAIRWRRATRETDLLLLLTFGAVLLSMLKSGGDYPHYWVQFLPLAGIFCAISAAALLAAGRVPRLALGGVAAGMIGWTVLIGTIGTLRVFQPGYLAQQHVIRATARDVAARMQPGDRVWAQYNHLVLWYLGAPLISPVATHPSNVVRAPILGTLSAAGYVDADEAGRLIAMKPEFVIAADPRKPEYLEYAGYDVPGFLAGYGEISRHGGVAAYQRRPGG